MKYFSTVAEIANKLQCKERTAREAFVGAKEIAKKESIKYYRNRVPNRSLNAYYNQPLFEVPKG